MSTDAPKTLTVVLACMAIRLLEYELPSRVYLLEYEYLRTSACSKMHEGPDTFSSRSWVEF